MLPLAKDSRRFFPPSAHILDRETVVYDRPPLLTDRFS
jgi:hypothetical protein